MYKTSNRFHLVDQYTAIRLGVNVEDIHSSLAYIIECPRRIKRETSYGFVHALWWIVFEDGRSVVSIPPHSKQIVEEMIRNAPSGHLPDKHIVDQLVVNLNTFLSAEIGFKVDRIFQDVVFACNAETLRPLNQFIQTIRIQQPDLPTAEGIKLPLHCFPEGIVYGVVRDTKVVSIAYAHRTGVMEDRVADLAVETSPAYRRNGYGKSSVYAVVRYICENGGEARYGCSPENKASRATAEAVGFVPYGKSLILSAPIPERDLKDTG